MFSSLARTARQLLHDLNRSLAREYLAAPEERALLSAPLKKYQPLSRVTIADEVSRTLFEEYAVHREGPRGHEETGWVILGLRESEEAVVLATLPAGTAADAGVAHVQFNSNGQALGSRIVRQTDRRLTILGVVHTHPGSLRHPSDGDYRGDSDWIAKLRGGEGIFGIGTADGGSNGEPLFAHQPKPHVQCLGPLCFSWYSLRPGDRDYRPLAYRLTLGPDLARPLHPIWCTIEAHAERLDRLCRQQAGVKFEVAQGAREGSLTIELPLAERGESMRVLLEGDDVRYYLVQSGEPVRVDLTEPHVDRGVYLLLAELAEHR